MRPSPASRQRSGLRARPRSVETNFFAAALLFVFAACGARTSPELGERERDGGGRSGAAGAVSGRGGAAGDARGGMPSAGTASGAVAGTLVGSGGQAASGGVAVGGVAGTFGSGGTPGAGGAGGVVIGGAGGVVIGGSAGVAGGSGNAGGGGDGAGGSGAGGEGGGDAGSGAGSDSGGNGGEGAHGGSGGVPPRATALALAAFHSCAEFEGGSVRCWGSGGYIGSGDTATIGDDEPASAAGDVHVGGLVTQISAGWYQTCAVLDDGRLRCWGDGFSGLLGYGNTTDVGDDETPAVAGDVNVGGTVSRVAAGSAHTCALLVDGTVRCWGQNDTGQLGYPGTDTIGDDEVPIAVGPVDVGGFVIELAAGRVHTCVLLAQGNVRCWGQGGGGRLGYGNTESIGDDEPPSAAGDVDLGGTAVQIVAGMYHTCALLETGGVRCWGVGYGGALGYGDTEIIGDDETPASVGDVDVGGIATQLAAGDYGTCAVLTTGAVRCWGAGDNGELGYGNLDNIGDDETPASAGDVDVGELVTAIEMGFLHTCAILQTGKIRCWGRGTTAALGYGNLEDIGDDETPASAGDVPTH